MELVATGCEDVIKAMLTVMDDIDRALAAMETAKDVASVRQGVLLIHQKLMDTLRSLRCRGDRGAGPGARYRPA